MGPLRMFSSPEPFSFPFLPSLLYIWTVDPIHILKVITVHFFLILKSCDRCIGVLGSSQNSVVQDVCPTHTHTHRAHSRWERVLTCQRQHFTFPQPNYPRHLLRPVELLRGVSHFGRVCGTKAATNLTSPSVTEPKFLFVSVNLKKKPKQKNNNHISLQMTITACTSHS